jgi:hypothetical protein
MISSASQITSDRATLGRASDHGTAPIYRGPRAKCVQAASNLRVRAADCTSRISCGSFCHLLRPRRGRPRGCRAAEITSLASASGLDFEAEP